MRMTTTYKKSGLSLAIVLMLLAVSPAQALAAATTAPKGYRFDPTTGLWENGTYAWNPTTGQTTPLKDLSYSYNPDTKRWDTASYRYDPTAQKYVDNQPSAPTAPTAATPQATPTPTSPPPQASSSASLNPTSSSPSAPTPSPTTSNKTQSSGLFDNFYKASISNRLDSSATSGDATVSHNTKAGGAASGAATTTATLINLLASSLSQDGKTPYTFISNILGNVFGDLTIDPGQLAKQLPADTSHTTVNNSSTADINNQVNLNAKSGSANVTGNTAAGNATSGNAAVIANLINAINSSISSGQSFIGAINIQGNLNGDILLPKGMLDQLLASNAGNTAASKASSTVTNADSQAITNQLNLAAKSGSTSVTDNTQAGSATSGQAKTSLTVLNFSGHQVADANTLLVFVNVLGHWVGMIFDAPSGATAAALGGKVTSNTTAANSDLANNSQASINNDLTANATSGDANVSHNTAAGNATSGSANVAVNVLNLTDSQISSANWFGVLFINILGNWFGSFGIDTAAGNQPTTSGGKGGGTPNPSGNTYQHARRPQVFHFTPHGSSGNSYSPLSYQTMTALGSLSGSSDNSNNSSTGSGSGTSTHSSGGLSAANPQPSEANNPTVPMATGSQQIQKDQPNWVVLSLMLSAGAALIGRQLILMLQNVRLRRLY